MKRHPRLIQLSREHHLALRLGRTLQRGEGVDELQTELPGLLAHFAEEERDLLPLLVARGHGSQAERLLAEHTQLRSLFDATLAGQEDAAAQTGQALVEHVRHEERELFPLLETLFDPS